MLYSLDSPILISQQNNTNESFKVQFSLIFLIRHTFMMSDRIKDE